MSHHIVQTRERTYLLSPDDQPLLGNRLWAVVKLRVIDELTGRPPSGSITIHAKERDLIQRVASDGIVGLVGIPQRVFPGLGTTSYTVHLTVKADGYLPRDEEVQVTADPQFPTTFTPPPLLNLALHREPTMIIGRTVWAKGDTTTPLAGTAVSVTRIWRTPPPFNSDKDALADPPNLVSLQPPLYSDREALTHSLKTWNLSPTTGSDKELLDHILPKSTLIRLSNRQGLTTSGDPLILLIDAGQPNLAEFIEVSSVPTTGVADQPAFISLAYPTLFAHRRGAVVQPIKNPPPPGMPRQIAVAALAGDTCIFLLEDVAGFATAKEVQITDGARPNEYHHVKTFSVASDADGYYRLPPLSRVAQVEIHAEKIVGTQIVSTENPIEFRPDYNLRENRLDLTLTV